MARTDRKVSGRVGFEPVPPKACPCGTQVTVAVLNRTAYVLNGPGKRLIGTTSCTIKRTKSIKVQYDTTGSHLITQGSTDVAQTRLDAQF